MKPSLLATLLALALPGHIPAGPLQKNQVPAAAKWVLHLDLEAALRSQIGSFVAKEFVDRQLTRPLRDLKAHHGLELDWRKVQSVTAYGTQFGSRPDEDGVILVRGDLGLPELLDKVMDSLGTGSPLSRQKQGGRNHYTLNDDIHGAAGPDGVFALSKSATRLEEALEVLDGKGKNLKSSKSFSRLPEAPEGFIFLGLAEGFGADSKVPQAKMLKQAEGGQLVAGEKAGQIFATVDLATKDAESAGQIQQVVQGLLALGAMNQSENKDLQLLIQATKVSTNESMVSVKVELPISNILTRVARELRKRSKE